jgi:hypothetical protein
MCVHVCMGVCACNYVCVMCVSCVCMGISIDKSIIIIHAATHLITYIYIYIYARHGGGIRLAVQWASRCAPLRTALATQECGTCAVVMQ